MTINRRKSAPMQPRLPLILSVACVLALALAGCLEQLQSDGAAIDETCENLCVQDIECYGVDQTLDECTETCIAEWDQFRADVDATCFQTELDAATCESHLACDELAYASDYCGDEFAAADEACGD